MALRPLIVVVAALAVAGSAAVLTQRRSREVPPQGSGEVMTIQEYTPRSRLVVAAHPVPRAKFPAIDVHSHHRPGLSGDRWNTIVSEIDALNLRILVNLSGGSGETLKKGITAIQQSAHPGRMAFFANLDFRNGVTPGFGKSAAANLEQDIKTGATGLKLFKEFGLRITNAEGKRVPVDDPELDPVWEVCARLNVPVLIHTGEPSAFFEPVDKYNERWLELTLLPQRRVPPPMYPTFEALMAERDRLFARHPKTRFIAAHMGWHADDLARLGKMLDRMPNVYVETGAILYDIGRQPHTARAFFEKYQDRILFGKDTYEASEYPYYWRVFETRDEYFDYYRKYHAFWHLYGIALPDAVLKKVYYQNALKVVPALPSAGFPQ